MYRAVQSIHDIGETFVIVDKHVLKVSTPLPLCNSCVPLHRASLQLRNHSQSRIWSTSHPVVIFAQHSNLSRGSVRVGGMEASRRRRGEARAHALVRKQIKLKIHLCLLYFEPKDFHCQRPNKCARAPFQNSSHSIRTQKPASVFYTRACFRWREFEPGHWTVCVAAPRSMCGCSTLISRRDRRQDVSFFSRLLPFFSFLKKPPR